MSENNDKIRATNVINGIALLKEKLGADAFAVLVAKLPEASRTLAAWRILAVEWVPMADWFAIFDAAVKQLYDGDSAQVLQLARELCALDFNSVYRFFLRVAPKAMLLNRAGKIWRTYHTMGELSVREEAEHGQRHLVRYTLSDYEPLPLMGVTLQGYVDQVLTMMGAKALETKIARCEIVNERLNVEISAAFDSPS